MTSRWLVLPAAIALGLVAETGWPRGTDPRLVVADLATGWLFIGGGFVVWQSRSANRIGPLLMATGVAWFAGTLQPAAAFLCLGPLVHLLAAHPTGRLAGRPSRIMVAAIYGLSAVSVVGRLDWVGLAIGVVIVGFGIAGVVRAGRRAGASRWATHVIATVVGLVLVIGGVARTIGSPIDDVALVAYELALSATVLSVVAEVVWRASAGGLVTRIVVDLGGAAEAGTLRDRLARAVGDPTLVLGYAVEGVPGTYADDTGAPVHAPPITADRSVTPIAVGGRQIGFVAHDPAIFGDPRVVGLIAAAAGLAMSNSATQAEIRRRVAEVAASRKRLVHAADAQGRRIESTLENGAEARLVRVAELLGQAAIARPNDVQLRSVLVDLADARQRLRDFARGVYPAALRSGGLAVAIGDLAARSPLEVETALARAARYDPAFESTLYFVCSEALANVAKHARATRVRIQLRDEPRGAVLRVEDNGVGGAAISGGSGLGGLADRVEALGGSFAIDSRPGAGTVVVAILPLRGAASPAPGVAEAVG